jgi:hypothetical protein
MTPIETPTPIPTLEPVEREFSPKLRLFVCRFWLVYAVLLVVDETVLVASNIPSTALILIALSVPQQRVLLYPQHQVSVPGHGVRLMA